MAWQLVTEVFEHAPDDLAPAERLVLVAIAEWVRAEGNRDTARKMADLGRRVGQRERALQRTLHRLATRGLEVRVPLGHDKKGRPLFAVPGTVAFFRLPAFTAPPGCGCQLCRPAKGPSERALANGKGDGPKGVISDALDGSKGDESDALRASDMTDKGGRYDTPTGEYPVGAGASAFAGASAPPAGGASGLPLRGDSFRETSRGAVADAPGAAEPTVWEAQELAEAVLGEVAERLKCEFWDLAVGTTGAVEEMALRGEPREKILRTALKLEREQGPY